MGELGYDIKKNKTKCVKQSKIIRGVEYDVVFFSIFFVLVQ